MPNNIMLNSIMSPYIILGDAIERSLGSSFRCKHRRTPGAELYPTWPRFDHALPRRLAPLRAFCSHNVMFSSRRDGPSAIEKDYLVRQLKQLLEALVKKILSQAQAPEQSQEDLREICRELLDVEFDALARLDVRSLAMLLRAPERVEAFALVMEAEATHLRSQGSVASADALQSRARSLRETQDPLT